MGARRSGLDGYHLLFVLGLGLFALAFLGGIGQLARRGEILVLHYDPLAQATSLKNQGQLAKAVGQYRMATLIDPSAEGSWFVLGYALAKAGDRVEAARAYDRVLQLNPGRADAHAALGDIALDLNQLPKAIEEFSLAVQLDPRLARAHNGLAIAYATSDRLDEAVRHFELAAALNSDPLTKANLERARSELAARGITVPRSETQ